MLEGLFVAASVLTPLAFGLVPAFLPVGVPILFRWILWLAILVVTGWYVHLLREAPSPHPLLALALLIVAAALSLIVLVVETSRPPRLRVRR